MYSILDLNNSAVTQGLNDSLGYEFSLNNVNSESDARFIVDYIVKYLNLVELNLKDQETMGFGSWFIKFIANGSYLEIHELKDVKDGINLFEFDISFTLQLMKDQIKICDSVGVSPNFPSISQKIAIMEDVYNGSEVNAVRYDEPSHMTGWYLTSNAYSGDIKELSVDYLFYILKEQPRIGKFLALPDGYRFFFSDETEEVWKDE